MLHTHAANLNTSTGIPSGGTLSFLQILRRTMEDFPCEAIGIIWDNKSKLRRQLYPDYKANRKADIGFIERYQAEAKILKQLLEALGIGSWDLPDREADDILYAMTRYREHNWLIMSDDKDLLLAVDDNVAVWRPMAQAQERDHSEGLRHFVKKSRFNEYTGVPFGYYYWYKVLRGDTSDNIPGVLGEVSALEVVNQMSRPHIAALQDVLIALSEDKKIGRYVKKALDAPGQMIMNTTLFRPEELTAQELAYCKHRLWNRPDYNEFAAVDLMQQLEFQKILDSYSTWAHPFRRIT